MKPCTNCGKRLKSTNARFCRTCYRRGLRVRALKQAKAVTREPQVLSWRAA